MIVRSRRGPGGWALMECLVLISVMTVLFALCAGTIRLLMKLDRAGRAARDQASDIRRLADLQDLRGSCLSNDHLSHVSSLSWLVKTSSP